MKTNLNLQHFFESKNIAVIGASPDKTKIGSIILQNLINSKGLNVVPVNPNHKHHILGLQCFPSVLSLKNNIDMAIIAVKSEIVPAVLEEIGAKKIPFAVIITSGFRETGSSGKIKEKEILRIAKKFNTRLLGPNCLGFITQETNASFGPNLENAGNLAVLSQSGAIGSSLVDYVNNEGIGLNSFVSLGNKADLNENDFLEYFKTQKNVRQIFLYLESFAEGQDFFQKTRELSCGKQIIVLKPGRTKSAARAMTSHTGALISDTIAYETAFSQANLINAENLEDFFNLIYFFGNFNFDKFKNSRSAEVKIITNAGGVGVLLSDLLPNVSPLDIGGGSSAKIYQESLLSLPRDLSALFLIITPQEVTEIEKTADLIVNFQEKQSCPIFTIIPGGNKVNEAHKILKKNGCLVYDYPEEAVRIYKKINNYSLKQEKVHVEYKNKFNYFLAKLNKQHLYLNLEDTQKLAQEYKLPINLEYLTTNVQEAELYAKKIAYPVVLKVHGAGFLHKTEFKAVSLNIKDIDELGKEYKRLSGLHGQISISKQIPASFEVIIGVKKDPDFGHLLMFGMGGIYAEIMKDLSYGLIPLTRRQIEGIIKKTKAYQIIEGARGLPKLYLKGIIDCIEKLNKLILENQWISELDINPLLVGENFVKIVDMKVK